MKNVLLLIMLAMFILLVISVILFKITSSFKKKKNITYLEVALALFNAIILGVLVILWIFYHNLS